MKNLTSAVGTPSRFIVRYRLEITPLIRRMLGPCDSNASKPEMTDLDRGVTLKQTRQQLSSMNILGIDTEISYFLF